MSRELRLETDCSKSALKYFFGLVPMVAAVRHSLLRFCARILRICRIVIPMGAVVAVGGVRTMVVVIMAVVHTAGNEG